jgi:hypothetical protein
MALPASLFSAIPTLFLVAPESELLAFLEEAHKLVVGAPALLAHVDADLDAHAKAKKAMRLEDAAWLRQQTATLPLLDATAAPTSPDALTLAQGRPRTPALVVYVALMLRGFFGAGFKSFDSTTMMQESRTLHVFFTNLGLAMPGRSTLTELVNAVSNETRQHILDAQIALALACKWDDFSTMLQDSTHVEGNTAWPTDSKTLVELVARMLRVGAQLKRLSLPAIRSPKAQKHLVAMTKLAREIALAPRTKGRARARNRMYGKLLWRARRVRVLLNEAVTQLEAEVLVLDVLPSRKVMAVRTVTRLRADVSSLEQSIANCDARVVKQQKVPVADKVLSVSDPDAGYIAKGQRVPVIGYKPQVARSGAGFITGLLLPQGNASDSLQLVPMFDEVVRRTTVVPSVLTVDDGYASKANVDAIRERKVDVISINGAKGRALTARADWQSEAYADARGLRSAVESLMYTLKQGFDFGYVARRGLAAAYGELLEKALAYNTCRAAKARAAENAPAVAVAAAA